MCRGQNNADIKRKNLRYRGEKNHLSAAHGMGTSSEYSLIELGRWYTLWFTATIASGLCVHIYIYRDIYIYIIPVISWVRRVVSRLTTQVATYWVFCWNLSHYKRLIIPIIEWSHRKRRPETYSHRKGQAPIASDHPIPGKVWKTIDIYPSDHPPKSIRFSIFFMIQFSIQHPNILSIPNILRVIMI